MRLFCTLPVLSRCIYQLIVYIIYVLYYSKSVFDSSIIFSKNTAFYTDGQAPIAQVYI